MREDQKLTTASDVLLGEISHKPPFLEVFLDRHQKTIIIVAIALIVGVLVYVISSGIQESKEQSSGRMLMKADDLSSLEKIVKEYSGTAAALSAKFRLANLQWEQGQQDEALKALESLASEAKNHAIYPMVKISLSDKLASQGKYDQAIEILHVITGDPSYKFMAPYAWISIGDINAKQGKKEEAADAYGQIKRDYEKSSFQTEATKRSLLVKAETPQEVVTAKPVEPSTEKVSEKPSLLPVPVEK